jgi:hypothetical protein
MIDIAKKLVLPILFVVCFLGAQKVKQEYDRLMVDYRETRSKVHELIDESRKIADGINKVIDSLKRVRSLEGSSDEE